jgi:hypothetical protein
MALNKKSIIQVVVLVVLLAVGGGVFLMQEQGGLDFISGLFGESPAPVPAKPKATAAKPGEGMPAAHPAASSEPVIPVQPVRGDLNGKPFVLERAYIEAGKLLLMAGTDANGIGVSVQLPSKPWEVPLGKRFKYLNAASPDAPLVRVSWAGEGTAPAGQQEFRDKYTLVVDLGQEKDRHVPGKFYLSVPGTPKNIVAGTFDAEIRGFRIIDGKPDLTSDSTETLQYLALRDLLKDDPDKNVSEIRFPDASLSDAASGATRTGYLEMVYRVGDAAPATKRMQFVKDKGEWRLAGTLKLNEINEAHPIVVPTQKDAPAVLFPYLVAKHIEAQVRAKSRKLGIFDTTFATRTNDKFKIGQCEASYRLENAKEPTNVTYILRKGAKGWAIAGELGKKQRINFDTGRIEKR